jgi:hypothetical protein
MCSGLLVLELAKLELVNFRREINFGLINVARFDLCRLAKFIRVINY